MANKKLGLFTSLATSALVAITMACEKPQESVLEQQTTTITAETPLTKHDKLKYNMEKEGWEFAGIVDALPVGGIRETSKTRDLYPVEEYDLRKGFLESQGYEVTFKGVAYYVNEEGKENLMPRTGTIWKRKKAE